MDDIESHPVSSPVQILKLDAVGEQVLSNGRRKSVMFELVARRPGLDIESNPP